MSSAWTRGRGHLRRRRAGRGRPHRGRRPSSRRRRRRDRSTRTDCIVIPGFVDSHRHTWETVIRGIAPDVSLGGYFDLVLDQLAPAYRPEDVYAGNYLGSLEAIDAGVTTLLDWSHISNSPEHADEAIRGLRDARLARRLLPRQPEHLARRVVVRQRARGARGHPPHPRALLLERRRADHARDGHARPRLLQARGRAATTGSSRARSARRSASTSAWAASPAAASMVSQLNEHGAARARHDLHPLQLPLRRGVPADRRQRAARSRSRPRSR